ncbi:hypothetical protein SKAU_G00219590 [Synaphobranchus kaupii]|uniref:Uncharacterized protein n=1 Tax=Synaphobranchus kaupii TaxID=118154 RepID=A0A9Q1IUV3_SYNKA|nr:hypothetical protein SKAU_G00219590 [Synaphobranchus kaupii]
MRQGAECRQLWGAGRGNSLSAEAVKEMGVSADAPHVPPGQPERQMDAAAHKSGRRRALERRRSRAEPVQLRRLRPAGSGSLPGPLQVRFCLTGLGTYKRQTPTGAVAGCTHFKS